MTDMLIKKIDKMRIDYVARMVVVKNGVEMVENRFEKKGGSSIGEINDRVLKIIKKKCPLFPTKKKNYCLDDVSWFIHIKLTSGYKWLVCEPAYEGASFCFGYRVPSPRQRAIRLVLQKIADESQYD